MPNSFDSAALVQALDQLLKKSGFATSKELADKLGVGKDLMYSWRQGRSQPSKQTALMLGKFDSTLTGEDVIPSCKKWLKLSGRAVDQAEIKAGLTKVSRPEDVPGFKDLLDKAISPLGKLILDLQSLSSKTEARLTQIVVCKLTQIAGTTLLEEWAKTDSNRGGSAMFVWNFELSKLPEIKDRLARVFTNWSPLFAKFKLNLIGCFVCGPVGTDQARDLLDALQALLRQGTKAETHFRLYFTTKKEPLLADLWFFNTRYGGQWKRELRGRLLEEPEMLREIIVEHGTPDLKAYIEDWTTMNVELHPDKVERFLRSYHIDFEQGGLVPSTASDSEVRWQQVETSQQVNTQ